MTALMWACHEGHKDVVQLLLDHSDSNIELNAKDGDGTTALMWACHEGHKDVVQLLLDHSDSNIELNAKDELFKACKNGGTKVVQLLLKCWNSEKSGLNTKDKSGYTPFIWACCM